MDEGADATLDGGGLTPAASGAYAPTDLSAGTLVHRYVVLSRLGVGGMGAVYAAFDQELDRKVALKLLHRPGRVDSRRGDRLLREAKAMAKLGHPNVVAIYDVGNHDGRIYLAMEFVDGRTLKRWRKEDKPGWREIVDVFVAAGRGLAAAHEAGLVHRDFKPDNVMVGPGARVRVMDFGLARVAATSSDAEGSGARPAAVSRADVTHDGVILGTPAYMSPEQHAGAEIGPASDQFAFCVALWEALYGERPFGGEGLADVVLSVTAGRIRSPPASATVPAWLRKVVQRGLARRPEDRHENMHALIAELQRGQSGARVRRFAVVAGALALTGVLGFGVHRFALARRTAACEAAGAQIEIVWASAQHEGLRAAVVATGSPYAESTLERLIPWVDGQAAAWASARSEACMRARVDGTWDRELEDRAAWCLDDRRLALDAVVDVLADADPDAVRKALEAATGLDRVETCLDADGLLRTPTPPEADRARIQLVREALSRARALAATGKYADALAAALDAHGDAEAIGWAPLVALSRYRVAALQRDNGADADAERGLEDAYFAALDADAPEVTFAAAVKLTILATRLDRPTDARRWARLANAALADLPDPFGLHRSELLAATAGVALLEGKHDESVAGFEEARVLVEAALGPEHLRVAGILGTAAMAERAAGRHLVARALHERALAIREKTLGADHPDVGLSLNSIGATYHAMAEYERAREYFERALALEEAAFGPDNIHLTDSLGNLAVVYRALGKREQAEPLEARELALLVAARGPDHVEVAIAEMNRATHLSFDGEHEKAVPLFEKVLRNLERALGPEHPHVAFAMDNLAMTHAEMGHADQARELFERVLVIREKVLGPDHPDTANTVLGLAEIALDQQRGADAVTLAERAVGILSNNELRPVELATAQFVLARALVLTEGDRARAVALAQTARAAFVQVRRNSEHAAEIDVWLRDQGGP